MIRNATAADIPACVALAERMHGESRFARLRFNAAKLTGLMDWCLANEEGFFRVATHEDRIIGGMLAACTPHWCSDDLVAYDFGLFVEPERRGGLMAAGLLRAFVRWAEQRGAVDITAGITTGVRLETTTALYEVVGFRKVGHLFSYQGE